MNTIYTIVVIDYYDHNLGTERTISAPNAYSDKELARTNFRRIVEEKLEELGYDIDEIEFKEDYDKMEYFNLWESDVDVEDEWFEIKIVQTNLN